MRLSAAAPAFALGIALSASAAVELPRPSPGATVSQKVGTAKVTVAYHRPAVKGRAVWGALVPYGEVWRLGANDATTLETTEDSRIAGKELKAGTYALFAIPTATTWTIVVNADPKQWGAYFRDAKKDVLTFEVTPSAGPHQEWLEFRFEPTSPKAVRIEMAWETLRIGFPLEFDVNGIVWRKLDAAMASAGPGEFIDFYQAARFARSTGERRDRAMAWLDEAMRRGSSFWMDELKGDLLADSGKYAEAVPHLEKAIEASKTSGAPEEWRDGARKKLAEWQAKGKAGG